MARQRRRERAKARGNRRRILFGIVAGTVGLLLVISLFVPDLLQVAARPGDRGTRGNQTAGTQVPVQVGEVIADGTPHEPYSTAPPTSGPRYAVPAAWGVHADVIAEEQVVRNLEQGGIAIAHNLTRPEDVASLLAFVTGQAGYPACLVVRPYPTLPAGRVSLTAWGWIQHFAGQGDTEGMQQFINAHRNARGPLFVNDSCGYVAPAPTATPAAAPTTGPAPQPTPTP